MNFSRSNSEKAQKATDLVVALQDKFTKILSGLSEGELFEKVEWLRDDGRHGGGARFVAPADGFFDRASVNVSHVHYDDVPEKSLASASALSAIVHPDHPHLPSIHIHFSYTEKRDGSGYWRMMADLNPSIPNERHTAIFNQCLKEYSNGFLKEGLAQGDQYFFIPALNRHRGVSHFYLEGFDSGSFEQDYEMSKLLASKVMDCYQELLEDGLRENGTFTAEEKQQQIDYHTLYFYQVLTLDKGTTAGIMVHNQNDLGVFGSLPSTINCQLLGSWIEKTPAPLNDLVTQLHDVFESGANASVGDAEKLAFAEIMRNFYVQHKELLVFQN